MKRLISMIIVILALYGVFASVSSAAAFSDVDPNDSFHDEIMYLVNERIIYGYPDGTFRPEENVTRAHAAMMIGRALGFDGTDRATEFADVEAGSEGSGYIAALADKEIIQGYPDGTFGPLDVVTRSQMALLLQRAFVSDEIEGTEYFIDVEPGMYFYEAIADLRSLDVAHGYPDGTFRPNVQLNRVHFSAFLARLLDPETFAPKRLHEEKMLNSMSLDEKIGQLVIAGLEGTSLQTADKRLVTDYHVGGLIFYADNLTTQTQTVQFVRQVKSANSVNKLPLFISVDQEGGRVARLPGVSAIPTNKAIGDRDDSAFAYSIGETLGQQLKSMDFNLNYAPVLDINSNPNNPVIGDRSYGNNSRIVSRMGIPTMKGIQSENIIPVIKHFPGHGDTSVDSHIDLPVVNKNLAQLEALELIPFENAINQGADVVMAAHILLPKIDPAYPSSMSEYVIDGLLREQLDFDGVIMTDDMTMGAIVNHYGIGEAAVRSIQAGSDIILVAHGAENAVSTIQAIRAAVQNGQISEQRINESVLRILHLKDQYIW